MTSPWRTVLRPLPQPQSPQTINTTFSYFSRMHQQKVTVNPWPHTSLDGIDYDIARPTFFIVHGFMSTGDFQWMQRMAMAILKKVDGNVFLVDWGNGALKLSYLQAAANTRVVAAEIVRLIRLRLKPAPTNVHLIGHSLGAQIMGYVGKNIPGIGRITALDAAQPAFESFSDQVRLTKNDAVIVDAHHTNGKPFISIPLGFGYMFPGGHVDFYYNGGRLQPGCVAQALSFNLTTLADLSYVTMEALGDALACDHCRSYHYFTEGIESSDCIMWGVKMSLKPFSSTRRRRGLLSGLIIHEPPTPWCTFNTCSPVGLETPLYPARGRLEVLTRPARPFCLKLGSRRVLRSIIPV